MISPFRIFLFSGVLICMLPVISPPMALILGIGGALTLKKTDELSSLNNLLLKSSVVLLGFGMNWSQVLAYSINNLSLTAFTIFSTLVFGIILGRLVSADKKTTLLIAVGTAICGGSAIAAMSPAIGARKEQLSYSLIVIFTLNAVALLVFPFLGHLLDLGQETFGTWAAIAIHDTSSVAGAGEAYGSQALKTAISVKLTRALWIIPVVIFFGLVSASGSARKVKIPWFIFLFVLAIVITYHFPQGNFYFEWLSFIGRKGMVLVLFLTGAAFNFSKVARAGLRPFIIGIILWVLISAASLFFLLRFG